MKIPRNPFESRQYMVRPHFELSHLRDVIPTDVEMHTHDFYELYYLNSGGSVAYEVEGRTYRLRPGDVVIINRGDEHRPVLSKNLLYDRILLWISADHVRELGTAQTDLSICFQRALDSGKNLLRMRQEVLGSFTQALGKLEKTYNSQTFGDDVYLKCFLAELLVLVNRSFMDIPEEEVEDEATSNQLVDGLLEYIDAHLDTELTLDLLSEQFFISKYHLMRVFKKYVGYTVHQYITLKRFMLAEKYLLENKSATEVFMRCGFRNYSTFQKAFTKHYGVTPSQFAKKMVKYNRNSLPG